MLILYDNGSDALNSEHAWCACVVPAHCDIRARLEERGFGHAKVDFGEDAAPAPRM